MQMLQVCLFCFANKDCHLSEQTTTEYAGVIKNCRHVFLSKNADYGASWRIMRLSSIVDQIYIKASRIRTIEQKGSPKVNEGVEPEYQGIINYCVMGLIQMKLNDDGSANVPAEKLLEMYDAITHEAFNLMQDKNHDYGEIWRDMQVSTFTDIILMRVHRIRMIMENDHKTISSEGADSNLLDMINYAVFALIRLGAH
jgi:hypothetical protein